MKTGVLLGLTALLALPGAACAQDERAVPSSLPASIDPITVNGNRATARTRIDALRRAVTPHIPSDEPMPRFSDPLCFAAAGLDRATLEQIGDRVVADAAAAGLALAGEACRPNVTLLLVDRVDAAFSRLRRRDATLFGDRTREEIDAIGRQAGPVRAWSILETRSRDGDRIGVNDGLKAASRTLAVPTTSRLFAPIRRDMLASILLVERTAVLGKTPVQIADYVVMRALAGVHPPDTARADTILSLFDPGNPAPAAQLTGFDRGYLKGLYSGSPNQLAPMHRSLIVRTILAQRTPEDAGSPVNSGAAIPPDDPAPAPDPADSAGANSPGSPDRAAPSRLPSGNI